MYTKTVRLCSALGIQRRIFVSPLLCFKHELYKGGIFWQSRIQQIRRRDVFAEGGRSVWTEIVFINS